MIRREFISDAGNPRLRSQISRSELNTWCPVSTKSCFPLNLTLDSSQLGGGGRDLREIDKLPRYWNCHIVVIDIR